LSKSITIAAERSKGGWTFRCQQIDHRFKVFRTSSTIDPSTMRGAIGDEAGGLRVLRSIVDRPLVRLHGDRMFVPDDLIAQ
jgi:hypothetical protein